MRREPTLRWARRALLLVAVACLGYWTWATADSVLYQRAEEAKLELALTAGAEARELTAGTASGTAGEAAVSAADPDTEEDPGTERTAAAAPGAEPATHRPAAPPNALGRLEIPRLGLQTVVARTSDSRSLRRAAGHVAGTALPGEGDNVGVAGHRDTVFRKLRHVALGDRVTLTTPAGIRRYTVDSLDIVGPDAVEVLAPTDGETLTLVTCYPFASLGPAPDRFIVRARLADAG